MTGPEESGSHPTAPRRPVACCSHLGYGLGSSPLSISQLEFSTCSPVLFFFLPLFFYLLYSISAPQVLSPRRRTGFGSQRTEERMGHCWHPEHMQGEEEEEENMKAEAAAVLGRGERGRKTFSSLHFSLWTVPSRQCEAVGLSNLHPLCAFPRAAAAPLPAPALHCPVSVPCLG